VSFPGTYVKFQANDGQLPTPPAFGAEGLFAARLKTYSTVSKQTVAYIGLHLTLAIPRPNLWRMNRARGCWMGIFLLALSLLLIPGCITPVSFEEASDWHWQQNNPNYRRVGPLPTN